MQLQLHDDVAQFAALGLRPDVRGRLSPNERAALARRWGGERWGARGALFGDDDEQLADGRRRLERALAGVATRLRCWPAITGREHLAARSDGLSLAWWGRRAEPPAERSPLADDCGLSWLIAAVPQRGDALRAALALVDDALAAADFDRAASLRLLDGRALAMVVPVLFDRADPAARARAAECHARLLDRLASAGFPPLRLGAGDRAPDGCRDSSLDADLARALDPAGVVSRGLYTTR